MSELENVQRSIIFTFFIYSVVLFVFFVVRFCKNTIDKEAGLTDDDGGSKYAQNDTKTKEDDKGVSQDKL